MKNKIQYEEFWQEREETLGQPVLAHSLVRTIAKDAPSEWGLLYITAYAIYFQTFASSNWFDILVHSEINRSKDSIEEIPLTSIDSYEHFPGKKGFLGIGATLSQLKLVFRSDSGQLHEMLMEIDNGSDKFLGVLNQSALSGLK